MLSPICNCIRINLNSHKHFGCKKIPPNNKFQILPCTAVNKSFYRTQLQQRIRETKGVSVLSLSGAIPSGAVGKAQIKAIPVRLGIPQGWDQHSWLAAASTTPIEHCLHAAYHWFPEVHFTGRFVLFCFNLACRASKPWGLPCSLACDWFVRARKISDFFYSPSLLSAA